MSVFDELEDTLETRKSVFDELDDTINVPAQTTSVFDELEDSIQPKGFLESIVDKYGSKIANFAVNKATSLVRPEPLDILPEGPVKTYMNVVQPAIQKKIVEPAAKKLEEIKPHQEAIGNTITGGVLSFLSTQVPGGTLASKIIENHPKYSDVNKAIGKMTTETLISIAVDPITIASLGEGAISSLGKNVTKANLSKLFTNIKNAAVKKLSEPMNVPVEDLNISPIEKKVINAFRQAPKLYEDQAAARTSELSRRATQAADVARKFSGEQGAKTHLSQFKGELPRNAFQGIGKQITQEEKDYLFNRILKSTNIIDEFDRGAASKGMMKVLGDSVGEVPTPSELKVLNLEFSDAFIKNLLNKQSDSTILKKGALELLNITRAAKAAWDFSFTLRQGIVLGARHPGLYLKDTAKAFRDAFSKKSYDLLAPEVKSRPTYKYMVKADVDLPEVSATSLKQEASPSNALLEKLPLIGGIYKASARHYNSLAIRLRADVFDSLFNDTVKLKGMDYATSDKYLRSLGKFINDFSGSGTLPKFMKSSAEILNAVAFSPKLLMSRFAILNPVNYVDPRIDPLVRKESLKTLISFVGYSSTILGTGLALGAKTSLNSNSPDFMKLKHGDRRVDPWSGLQQEVVLASRMASLTYKHLTNGKGRIKGTTTDNVWDVLQTFGSYKLAPTAGYAYSIGAGKTATGEKLDLLPQFAGLFVPLMASDMLSLMQDGEISSAAIAPLVMLGMSTQTYRKGTGGSKIVNPFTIGNYINGLSNK